MSDRSRKFGFLRPKERAYLYEQDHYLGTVDGEGPEQPANTKSRIKNEVVANLDDVISDFRRDLLAVSNFQRAATLHDQFVYENTTLSFSKSELESLKRQIEGMIEQAEDHPVSAEREELGGVLELMYGTVDLEDPAESDNPPDAEELEELYSRRQELSQHLYTVLSKEGLPEILAHIGNHGKCELSGRRINGEGEWWAQVASRELVPELATKDEETVGAAQYELTDDGEAVLECWEGLQETKTIQIQSDLRPDESTRKIVLQTLAEHFPKNYSG
ncbi:hypothetical protein ABSL23_03065 [Halobacterium sp. NMX12-1]|uniref:Uncharacterized protein n=1 Tax=Halobacterium sp. NMX12-1 TaxID=3166650 RepID=A0AAU8CEH4_9EURY